MRMGIALGNIDFGALALRWRVGRVAVATTQMAQMLVARDPFDRAAAMLRACRTAPYPLAIRQTSGYLRKLLLCEGSPVLLKDNVLLQSFSASPKAEAIRRQFVGYGAAHQVRMRYPRTDEDEVRQGDLIVLKAPDERTSEKGVLLVKYTESIARFAAIFQVERLVQRYQVVLEPSWWGYQDPSFFMFVGSDADVIVQSQAKPDFEFIAQHGFGLIPLRIGAGDWVDPRMFAPGDATRQYDVVMVSSWNPFKRHRDLFAALREARVKHGRTLRVALVGYPNGWTAEDIERQVRRFGLESQCQVFNQVPSARVAEIVGRSKLYVLVSRREGANKAMYEAMFCDTPVLAPRDHKGINVDHLNDQTGLAFARGNLTEGLMRAVDQAHTYSPRAWALKHTGYENATRQMNEALAEASRRRGDPWRRPIVAKKNQPNLRYASENDRLALESEYDRLIEYLRPVEDE